VDFKDLLRDRIVQVLFFVIFLYGLLLFFVASDR
jgi:hypothetical protein